MVATDHSQLYADITQMYRSEHKNPVTMARLFKSGAGTALTLQELARKTGVTIGTIHSYISLLDLPQELIAHLEQGQLSFKAGRALADIKRPDLLELAKPFIGEERTLSSVHVEQYVQLAKRYPQEPPSELVSSCLSNEPIQSAQPEESQPPAPREQVVIRPEQVSAAAIELTGLLRTCCWDDSVHSLKAKSMLKLLRKEMEEVVP